MAYISLNNDNTLENLAVDTATSEKSVSPLAQNLRNVGKKY
ncbi:MULTISPECIES: hypothetical protein [Photorhabdus]|nr:MULTISPECIES: hypothetical protein [Photorhabdus]